MSRSLNSIAGRFLLLASLSALAACGGGSTVGLPLQATEDAPVVQSPITGNVVDTTSSAASVENDPAPIKPPVEPPAQPASASADVKPAVTVVQADPAPAAVAPTSFSVDDITDLILVTGQSNALGADTDFDPEKDSPHRRVFAFTEQGWRQADLHQVWDQGWFPRGHPGADPSNNLSLHMAKEIAHQRPGRVVGFILASAPGMGIAHWGDDEDFFAQIDRKVLNAINQVPHKSRLDGILWHQGETDEGDYSYGEKLNQLISKFRRQNWFGGGRAFICGETAAFDVVNNQLMALNSNGDYWTSCVNSAGLGVREDGYHFNAEGLRELGRRYARRYLKLTN